ncbi:hypothetical protein P4V47_01385 [Brevibacillus laterosporus]|uniref:hypothetical protein n=1 Tax=Brevibacillus laterosporus TaxID=1465 RepID=UPI002E218C49|nr:hypothetical protein [Brevibacillus laterosporus]
MGAFTAWAVITVALFILIGISVYSTGSLAPLWLSALPFFISIKDDAKKGNQNDRP